MKVRKIKTRCGLCGKYVWIPPGIFYKGIPMHKQEADEFARKDYSREKLLPKLMVIEQELRAMIEGVPKTEEDV